MCIMRHSGAIETPTGYVRTMARKRGRAPGFIMTEEHRRKIANSNVLKYLLEHVQGKRELSATQAQVGLGLLKKVLPDLQSVEHNGNPENPIETVTRIELVAPDGYSTDRTAAEAPTSIQRPS